MNNRVRDILSKYAELPIDLVTVPIGGTAGSINSGDLCYWTSLNGVCSLGTGLSISTAQIALYPRIIGVCRDTNPLTVGGIATVIQSVGVDGEGQFYFNTTAADTYYQFTPVTIGADAQTITVAPGGPSLGTLSGTGSSGTWGAGTYNVQATYATVIGETSFTSASVTLTSSQGILTNVISPPAWALGVNWYVNGRFNVFSATGGAVTMNSPLTTSNTIPPLPGENALAIGWAVVPEGLVYSTPPASITGAAGVKIGVILKPLYPAQQLL